jgi:hypothetical protein
MAFDGNSSNLVSQDRVCRAARFRAFQVHHSVYSRDILPHGSQPRYGYRDYRPIIKDGGLLDQMIRSKASAPASKPLMQALVDNNKQIMYSHHKKLMYNGAKFIVGNATASVLLDVRSDVLVCP